MTVVSGLFDDYDDALTAVNQLQALGIDRAQITLRQTTPMSATAAGQRPRRRTTRAAGAGMGAVVGGAGGLLAGLGMFAIPVTSAWSLRPDGSRQRALGRWRALRQAEQSAGLWVR